MGKGRGPGGDSASEHVSRPLTTLKDPALFGPPPRNVNYHGGAALPNEITPQREGLGAPLSKTEVAAAEQQVYAPSLQEEEEAKPAGPPLPYRADRTGLKTDHLPPPPVHRAIVEQPTSQTVGTTQVPPKARPSVPPRLPSRKESSDFVSSPPAAQQPPTYDAAVKQTPAAEGGLNQNAVSRLGKAGISVPGFGIGESNPWKTERSSAKTSAPTTTATPTPQLNELQSRFARMSSASPKPETVPAEGTTIEQKQAAFKTAQDLHKDPSSVTLADAQGAASTVNNFRQRHQEQISASAQKANTWNKKFNVTGRVNNFLEKQTSPVAEQPPAVPSGSPAVSELTNRKPPPPPPPKKPAGFQAPPPVPIGTKPNFG